MAEQQNLMDKIVSLCKRRGFVFQGSEIYGGLAGTWDYGPYGVALKNNIKQLWWKKFVEDREDMYGVDAAILMNQKVWQATGHVSNFSDPLVECQKCKHRFRVDQIAGFSQKDYKVVQKEYEIKLDVLIDKVYEEAKSDFNSAHEYNQKVKNLIAFLESDNLTSEQKDVFFDLTEKLLKQSEISINSGAEKSKTIKGLYAIANQSRRYAGMIAQVYLMRFIFCPFCRAREWGVPTQFNMMFKTFAGAEENDSSVSYLRPETAQGMFVNYKNIIDSFHPRLPFGMAQVGKVFRNEIAPRDFLFRAREFEQMEIEYLIRPPKGDEWKPIFEHFKDEMISFSKEIGLDERHIHPVEIADADRAFYSKRTIDVEFDFPFGQTELYGLAYRTDYDLKRQGEGSGVPLDYLDEETKEKFIPHCIEPSFGLDRAVLAVLSDAFTEDTMGDEQRTYLKLLPKVAPIKVAVFPLLRNKPQLVEKAREVYTALKKEFGAVEFDDNGNIGKRYRRQDEIGTPFCVTIDFDSLEKNDVTVRDRDTGKQERIAIDKLVDILSNKFSK